MQENAKKNISSFIAMNMVNCIGCICIECTLDELVSNFYLSKISCKLKMSFPKFVSFMNDVVSRPKNIYFDKRTVWITANRVT